MDDLLLPVKCRKKRVKNEIAKKETMIRDHFELQKIFSSNRINPTVARIKFSHISIHNKKVRNSTM